MDEEGGGLEKEEEQMEEVGLTRGGDGRVFLGQAKIMRWCSEERRTYEALSR